MYIYSNLRESAIVIADPHVYIYIYIATSVSLRSWSRIHMYIYIYIVTSVRFMHVSPHSCKAQNYADLFSDSCQTGPRR